MCSKSTFSTLFFQHFWVGSSLSTGYRVLLVSVSESGLQKSQNRKNKSHNLKMKILVKEKMQENRKNVFLHVSEHCASFKRKIKFGHLFGGRGGLHVVNWDRVIFFSYVLEDSRKKIGKRSSRKKIPIF